MGAQERNHMLHGIARLEGFERIYGIFDTSTPHRARCVHQQGVLIVFYAPGEYLRPLIECTVVQQHNQFRTFPSTSNPSVAALCEYA